MSELIKNKIWIEKYRPIKVEDVLGEHTPKILNYLKNPSSIPNFLFYSRIGGTGKSSMAKAIVKDLNCDLLYLNASDDRSIDTIRNKVKSFIGGMSTDGFKRCVIFEESERLTLDAAESLKNIIEDYSSNAFFIFTTNKVEKISQPLRSRFVEYEFSRPGQSEIKTYLINICKQEELTYNDEGVSKLINIHYPSIRRMVGLLQDLSNQGLTVIPENITSPDDKHLEFLGLIKNKKYIDIKNKVYVQGYDIVSFVDWLFDYCMKGKLPLKQELQIIKILAVLEDKFSRSIDEKKMFMGYVVDLIKVFNEVEK